MCTSDAGMRIISVKRVRDFWSVPAHADSKTALSQWLSLVSEAAWSNPASVKNTFGKRVDFVRTRRTRNSVAVFDIGGNKYRLIASIHYLSSHFEKGRVYVHRIMNHKEYDLKRWQDEL
jgi:mRNA interferase HigB